MKWSWGYLINPLAAVADWVNERTGNDEASATARTGVAPTTSVNDKWSKFKNWFHGVWDDLTGQTAIEKQFEMDKELAQYQTEMQEELYNKYSSPSAIKEQYTSAGLNPNLMYGSAGSGQGNVPTYESPKAVRKMSPIEQMTVGLGIIHNLMNIQNARYNLDASREMSEQAGIKTLNLFEDLIGKRQKNSLEGHVTGYHPIIDWKPQYLLSLLGRQPGLFSYDSKPNQYSRAMRNYQINRAFKTQMDLGAEYGRAYDFFDNEFKFGDENYIPNMWWRNKVLQFDAQQRQFNYDWDSDYKSALKFAGVASPIIQVLLRIMGGK